LAGLSAGGVFSELVGSVVEPARPDRVGCGAAEVQSAPFPRTVWERLHGIGELRIQVGLLRWKRQR
jgi:hypothetical protein